MSKSQDLGQFDDQDVLGTGIKVTNAGDGLSQAMKVDPQLLHMGDVVHVVLECEVADVTFKPIKDTDAVQRVHTLRAGTATMVDGDLVAEQLDEQAERIQAAKDAAEGKRRMFDASEDQLAADHEDGGHADELVDRCPLCKEEADLAADEDDPGDPDPIS